MKEKALAKSRGFLVKKGFKKVNVPYTILYNIFRSINYKAINHEYRR